MGKSCPVTVSEPERVCRVLRSMDAPIRRPWRGPADAGMGGTRPQATASVIGSSLRKYTLLGKPRRRRRGGGGGGAMVA